MAAKSKKKAADKAKDEAKVTGTRPEAPEALKAPARPDPPSVQDMAWRYAVGAQMTLTATLRLARQRQSLSALVDSVMAAMLANADVVDRNGRVAESTLDAAVRAIDAAGDMAVLASAEAMASDRALSKLLVAHARDLYEVAGRLHWCWHEIVDAEIEKQLMRR